MREFTKVATSGGIVGEGRLYSVGEVPQVFLLAVYSDCSTPFLSALVPLDSFVSALVSKALFAVGYVLMAIANSEIFPAVVETVVIDMVNLSSSTFYYLSVHVDVLSALFSGCVHAYFASSVSSVKPYDPRLIADFPIGRFVHEGIEAVRKWYITAPFAVNDDNLWTIRGFGYSAFQALCGRLPFRLSTLRALVASRVTMGWRLNDSFHRRAHIPPRMELCGFGRTFAL